MKGERLAKLASIGSTATGHHLPNATAGSLPASLAGLLRIKNGFYAFESALHVFSTDPILPEPSLAAWNQEDLWRFNYPDLDPAVLFFAEDIFGEQFGFIHGKIVRFDPETGTQKHIADDIEGWADQVLGDYNVMTGYPLARDWQAANGPLPIGSRLVPKQLFMLGGEFSVVNLKAMDAKTGMKVRGEIAALTRHLPDGTKIRFKIVP